MRTEYINQTTPAVNSYPKSYPKANFYRWLKRSKLPLKERATMRALIKFANEAGVCKISWSAICDETGMQRTTLYRTLKSLREKGLVSSALNYNRRGKRVASTYTLHIAENAVQNEPVNTRHEGSTKFQSETPITVDLSDTESLPGVRLDSTVEEDTAALPPPQPRRRAEPAFVSPVAGYWLFAAPPPNPYPDDPEPLWPELPVGPFARYAA